MGDDCGSLADRADEEGESGEADKADEEGEADQADEEGEADQADEADETVAWGDLPIDPDVTPSDRDLPAGAGPPRGWARMAYVADRLRGVLRRRWDILLVIAAGGAIGSLARWGLTLALPHAAGTFPWATFVANVTGCGLIGVLMVLVIEVWPPSRYVRPFLGVGILGGYTTFSTYMLDARALLVAGRAALAGQYVFGSLAAGLAAVWIAVTGTRLGVRAVERRHASRRQKAIDRGGESPDVTSSATPSRSGSTAAAGTSSDQPSTSTPRSTP